MQCFAATGRFYRQSVQVMGSMEVLQRERNYIVSNVFQDYFVRSLTFIGHFWCLIGVSQIYHE